MRESIVTRPRWELEEQTTYCSSTHRSFVPLPWLEFTTSELSFNATRVKPPGTMPRKKGTLPSGFARERERGLHAPAGRHVLLLRKREDVDSEARVVGGGKVAHVLFDEEVLHLDVLGVEVGRDRLVGGVDVVVGTSVNEAQRPTGGCRSEAEVGREVRRAVLRGAVDRKHGVVAEAVVVRLREHHDRTSRRPDPGLGEFVLDALKGFFERREGLFPGARAGQDGGRLRRQRHLVPVDGIACVWNEGRPVQNGGRRGRRRRADRRRRPLRPNGRMRQDKRENESAEASETFAGLHECFAVIENQKRLERSRRLRTQP